MIAAAYWHSKLLKFIYFFYRAKPWMLWMWEERWLSKCQQGFMVQRWIPRSEAAAAATAAGIRPGEWKPDVPTSPTGWMLFCKITTNKKKHTFCQLSIFSISFFFNCASVATLITLWGSNAVCGRVVDRRSSLTWCVCCSFILRRRWNCYDGAETISLNHTSLSCLWEN